MIRINGEAFYEEPGSCGTCPFFYNGSTQISAGSERGHCRVFNEMHRSTINPPRRCQKLFRKAFKQPEGSDLLITFK